MKSIVRFVLQWGFTVALAVVLLRYLQSQWTQLEFEFLSPNWPVVALSLLTYCIGMALLPYNSWQMQRWFDYRLSAYTMWRSFYIAQFVKYLPGGFWSIPGRAVLYYRSGIPAVESGTLVILEIFGMVIGSCLVALLSLPVFLPLLIEHAIPAALSLIVGIVALGIVLRLTRKRWYPAINRVSPMSFLYTCGIYALNWIVLGTAFALLAPGLNLPVRLDEVIQIIGIHAVAWVIGFVVIITPGGIGVREAILAIGLTPFFPMPFPVIISLLARIGWTLAEIIGYLVIIPLLGRMRKEAQ